MRNGKDNTVVGDQHQTGVHTEVERVSRLLFAHPVPHIRAKETCLAQLCIFGSLPRQARQSTTLDNGSENYLHTQLQEELGIRTYFAHPYCSWQRGTNEYTNGLLRRYFPKRTDFRNVTQEQLNVVAHRRLMPLLPANQHLVGGGLKTGSNGPFVTKCGQCRNQRDKPCSPIEQYAPKSAPVSHTSRGLQ